MALFRAFIRNYYFRLTANEIYTIDFGNCCVISGGFVFGIRGRIAKGFCPTKNSLVGKNPLAVLPYSGRSAGLQTDPPYMTAINRARQMSTSAG